MKIRDLAPDLSPFLRCVAAAMLLAGSAACTSAPLGNANAAPAAVTETPGLTLLAQIKKEIGNAPCSSTAQCRTLPIGYKACGGPERYLAWSIQASDSATLQGLADRLKTAQKTASERSGMVSNCMAVVDPGAVCVAGQCVLGDPLQKGLPAR